MLPEAALRVTVAWAALAAAVVWGGHAFVEALLPLLVAIGESLSQEFSAAYLWAGDEPNMLLLRAQLLQPSAATAAIALESGQIIETGTNLEHVLVPPVIVLTVVLGWPARSLVEQLRLIVLGLLATLASIALTTPFLLAGKIEALLAERATSLGLAREPSLLVHWMLFTEGGGRWLLAVLLALICVRASAALDSAGRSQPATAR